MTGDAPRYDHILPTRFCDIMDAANAAHMMAPIGTGRPRIAAIDPGCPPSGVPWNAAVGRRQSNHTAVQSPASTPPTTSTIVDVTVSDISPIAKANFTSPAPRPPRAYAGRVITTASSAAQQATFGEPPSTLVPVDSNTSNAAAAPPRLSTFGIRRHPRSQAATAASQTSTAPTGAAIDTYRRVRCRSFGRCLESAAESAGQRPQ